MAGVHGVRAAPARAGGPRALDGKPASYLKSSGIGHAMKKIELGVAGKDGVFDEIKVWNAEPSWL